VAQMLLWSSWNSMLTLQEVPWSRVFVIHVEGPLRAPVKNDLRRRVCKLIDRGEGKIVLDLSRVSDLDAAGIGELVHVYNMAIAANGSLRIAHAAGKVQRILDRVGLFDLLSKVSVKSSP
jgi:anti-anti-sigma factor